MKFLSVPFWITGLQELQHITRLALFQNKHYKKYIDVFLSMPIWITGLQELHHITRVALFQNEHCKKYIDEIFEHAYLYCGVTGVTPHYKDCTFSK